MKFGKTLLITALVTLVCFVLSFVTAPKGTDEYKSYPESLFGVWMNSHIFEGADIEVLRHVTQHKDIHSEGVERVLLRVESTDIQLVASDSNLITLDLNGQFQKAEPMDIGTSPTEVEITIKHPKRSSPFQLNFGSAKSKLVVTIPTTVRELQIEKVSGDLSGQMSGIRSLDIASVSGNVKLGHLDIPVMKIATVSGDVDLAGKFASVKLVSVSGDVSLTSETAAPALQLDSTSGDLHVTFHAEPDVDVKFSSMSGKSIVLGNKTKEIQLGSGSGSLVAETISGNLTVSK